jgi:uncharacterized protein (TIGR00255 family)
MFMTLASMTGFAEAQAARGDLRWRWEVKSVNGRGLDLRLRLPPGFDGVELAARALVARHFKRGSLQATLNIESGDNARALRVDREALAAAIAVAKSVAAESGLPPARVDGILALKGVLVQDDGLPQDADARAERDDAVLKSLGAAFDALQKARTTEGAKLATVFETLTGEIEALVRTAMGLAAAQPQALRARLEVQLRDLVQPGVVSPERLAQEVALLAARADVREELDRLTAHVAEARRLLQSGEAVGRKLDFLAQEFNREANTLCSKSTDIELTRTGLALKAAIDQFREQAQNVE